MWNAEFAHTGIERIHLFAFYEQKSAMKTKSEK